MEKSLKRLMGKTKALDNGCWVWLASLTNSGYGLFWLQGRYRLAHQASYYLAKGIMSTRTLQIDHLCKERRCVNPAHMELVSPRINTLRAGDRASANRMKTHCKRGHAFTLDNTDILRDNHRRCRTCKHSADVSYRAAYPDRIKAAKLKYRGTM